MFTWSTTWFAPKSAVSRLEPTKLMLIHSSRLHINFGTRECGLNITLGAVNRSECVKLGKLMISGVTWGARLISNLLWNVSKLNSNSNNIQYHCNGNSLIWNKRIVNSSKAIAQRGNVIFYTEMYTVLAGKKSAGIHVICDIFPVTGRS